MIHHLGGNGAIIHETRWYSQEEKQGCRRKIEITFRFLRVFFAGFGTVWRG